jgi:hypothetical protein
MPRNWFLRTTAAAQTETILGDYRETLQYLNRAAFDLVPIDPVSRISVRPGSVGNNAIREPVHGISTLD